MPRVTVCWSPAPREVLEWPLELPEGASARCGAGERLALRPRAARCRRWASGAAVARAQQAVREGDRVEIYRALKVDPKVAPPRALPQAGRAGAGPVRAAPSGREAGLLTCAVARDHLVEAASLRPRARSSMYWRSPLR
jgi:hypothetical protein